MKISVADPIAPAWNHMVRICFQPFSFKKWLALGFCAFLAQCGQEVGSNSSNSWSNQNNTNWNQVSDWIQANLAFFITVVSIVVICFIALVIFITWLSSRGKFMLLDGIIKNRGVIKEPWAEFRELANSLFGLSIVIDLLAFVVFILIIGIGVLIALPDFSAELFTGFGITAIAVTSVLLLCYLIVLIAIKFFMQVFLVPTMYLKRVRAVEGWKIAWAKFYKNRKWVSFLYFLMWTLLSFCAGFVAVAACCATCCIAALPYISSVVLLPVSVFFVCYSITYIQQFGSDWTFFKNLCSKCNYDLRGLEEGHPCPECGNKLN